MENDSLAFDPSKVVSVYKDEINHLKDENDALAKALGKTTVERDWAMKAKELGLINVSSGFIYLIYNSFNTLFYWYFY